MRRIRKNHNAPKSRRGTIQPSRKLWSPLGVTPV
jgi:hypothetical protein